MTLNRYRFVREALGLSQEEAAHLHGVALDTISKWERGRRDAPPGVHRDLLALQQRLETAVAELASAMAERSRTLPRTPQRIGEGGVNNPMPPTLKVGVPSTPADAYEHGFPSHQAMVRTIGLAIAQLPTDVAVEFVRIGQGEHVTARLAQPVMAN